MSVKTIFLVVYATFKKFLIGTIMASQILPKNLTRCLGKMTSLPNKHMFGKKISSRNNSKAFLKSYKVSATQSWPTKVTGWKIEDSWGTFGSTEPLLFPLVYATLFVIPYKISIVYLFLLPIF